MHRFVAFVPLAVALSVAVLCPATAPAAEPPPAERLLDADVDFVLHVPDMAGWAAVWSGTPWAEMLNDPGVRDRVNAGEDDHDPADIDFLWNVLDRAQRKAEHIRWLTLAVPHLDLLMDEATGDDAPAVLIVSATDALDADAWLREIVMHADNDTVDVEIATETYREYAVAKVTYTRNGERQSGAVWTVHDDVVVVSPAYAYLREVIDALEGDVPAEPLTDNERYREACATAGDADAWLFLDFDSVVEKVNEQIREADEAPVPGVQNAAVAEALGLDALRYLTLAYDQGPDETRVAGELHYADRRGLMSLMTYGEGPVPRPAFIPESVLGVAVQRFDVRAFWDNLIDLVETAMPSGSAMVRGQLDQMSLGLGFDIETDLIDNLGDDGFTALFLPGEGPDAGLAQVFGFEVNDPERMVGVVENLAPMLAAQGSGLEMSEVNGVTLYSMRGLPPYNTTAEGTSSVAVTGKHVMFSTHGPEPLARMLTGSGPSVWEKPEFAPFLSDVPEEAAGVFVYDVSALLEAQVAQTLRMMRDVEGDEQADRMDGFPWARLASQLDVMAGYTLVDDDRLRSVTRITHPR